MIDRKEAIVAKLIRTREQLLAVTLPLTDEQWVQRIYSEGSDWSAADVLRHVADSEKGMTALIMQIKDGGEGVPPDFDLDRWNRRAVSKLEDKTPQELLIGMSTSREKLLAFIETLQPEDWEKKGRHASLRIMSIEEVCHLIADHEAGHAADIQKAIPN